MHGPVLASVASASDKHGHISSHNATNLNDLVRQSGLRRWLYAHRTSSSNELGVNLLQLWVMLRVPK